MTAQIAILLINRRIMFRLLPITGAARLGLLLMVMLIAFGTTLSVPGQSQYIYQSQLTRRNAFRQEIARLEIMVDRKGYKTLPISLVPRVRRNDTLRVRMLDEPINGIRPSESFWNWTLVVAFVNPSRNEIDDESVSREVQFRRDGWYKEHLFNVPYDSQPVFFLYPKPKYRKKIRKLIKKNFNEIKKIGEKTLEIAGAYAQIGMFLNELQGVISKSPSRVGSYSRNYIAGRSPGPQFIQNQMVERLAQSFNIALPSCWTRGAGNYRSNDFVSRAQCVAKNVRLEDFDLSVSRILKQGGLLAATQLIEKYPQLAYWINVAAAAADLIIRILQKTPLKVVPTIAQSTSNRVGSFSYAKTRNFPNPGRPLAGQKVSLFAEKPPSDSEFVTAYPIVLHKWQPEPDPEVISLPVPSLPEPCLHTGPNILKNTDLSYDWLRDPFARDFKLTLSAGNSFTRELPLTRNLGMSGWILMLNANDVKALPNIRMDLKAKIVATRGFSRIESEYFKVPVSGIGKWEVKSESAKQFVVGGKRRIVVRNTQGSSLCLQSVTYKPAFGGEFRFTAGSRKNALQLSGNGVEAWFEINTVHFKPGKGTLIFQNYGNNRQKSSIPLKLFPKPPEIESVSAHRGDNRIRIEGERTDQIKRLRVNGKLATLNTNGMAGNTQTFVFSNSRDLILSRKVLIEMFLEGGRAYKYPVNLNVLPARPAVQVDRSREISAIALSAKNRSRFNLNRYPVFPIDTRKISVSVKTALTDYSFKSENIRIETKIENGGAATPTLPQAEFEVLDPLHLKIEFEIGPRDQKLLAGRRLEFRIVDQKRGSSDWYKIRQTFIRVPKINSIDCRKSGCRITGNGVEYIGQISIDAGKTWIVPDSVKTDENGRTFLSVPPMKSKKLLRIRLRDFPKTEGLEIYL